MSLHVPFSGAAPSIWEGMDHEPLNVNGTGLSLKNESQTLAGHPRLVEAKIAKFLPPHGSWRECRLACPVMLASLMAPSGSCQWPVNTTSICALLTLYIDAETHLGRASAGVESVAMATASAVAPQNANAIRLIAWHDERWRIDVKVSVNLARRAVGVGARPTLKAPAEALD
jgi:hypothetical protein